MRTKLGKKSREQARNSATGVQGGLMITSVFPSSSPSPPPPPPPHVERCQGPSRVPLHVICIETSRRGEAVGFRAKSVRDETVEAWREAEETLEGGSGSRSWNSGRGSGGTFCCRWTPHDSHGNSPWDVPTRCFRGARFSAARFCTRWFSWKQSIQYNTIFIKIPSTFRYTVARTFRFFALVSFRSDSCIKWLLFFIIIVLSLLNVEN